MSLKNHCLTDAEKIQKKLWLAYRGSRASSHNRGLGFFFSFEEWVKWWEDNLGPNWKQLRGNKKGQFVMARKGDKGNYEPSNVECVTFEQNIKDATTNKARTGPKRKRNILTNHDLGLRLLYKHGALQLYQPKIDEGLDDKEIESIIKGIVEAFE